MAAPYPSKTIVVKTTASQFPLRIFDTPLCLEITRSILEGKTYPRVDFVKDVSVVVEIGANIGAASVYFGLQYPRADTWCFEPNPAAYALLQQNALHLPNLRPHNIGLFNRDCETPLHVGNEDSATSSIGASYLNGARSVHVQLRDARTFFREQQFGALRYGSKDPSTNS